MRSIFQLTPMGTSASPAPTPIRLNRASVPSPTTPSNAGFTPIIGADGTSTLITDKITRSPAQADVSFYNLSDIALADLYVPQAKAVAIKGVAANSGGSVALKAPLTLDFEVKAGDTVLATVAAVGLVRREGVAIVLSGTAGNYTATVTANSLSLN